MYNGIVIQEQPVTVLKLNTNKIHTLDDVKRVLDFLNIEVRISDGITVRGYEDVKDLFGN